MTVQILVLLLGALIPTLLFADESIVTPPRLPGVEVETGEFASTGRDIVASNDFELRRILKQAKGDETIVLIAGTTYEGPFVLPRKRADAWTIIKSDQVDRIGDSADPSKAVFMARLVAERGPVLIAAPGAHHFRFEGVEIARSRNDDRDDDSLLSRLRDLLTTTVPYGDNLVLLSPDRQGSDRLYPNHISFDRCYIHGDPYQGTRRGLALNGEHLSVTGSYLSDFKRRDVESQAVAAWDGRGPILIADNYLEAAGENILVGGGDPGEAEVVPGDIKILRNTLTKPLSWRALTDDGVHWQVKNLLELKNARRVLIEGNLLQHNWPDAQNGFSILFTPRNQDGGSPWSVVEDVTFRNNVVRQVADGINILGTDDIHNSRRTSRIAIDNNLFVEVGEPLGSGRFIQLLDGLTDISVIHNTVLQTAQILKAGSDAPHERVVFMGNIVRHNEYGIVGTGTGPGLDTIRRYFRDARFDLNVLIGGSPDSFPGDNWFAPSVEAVGFINVAGKNFELSENSPYYAEQDRPGVDMNELCLALSAVHRTLFCNTDQRSVQHGC